MPVSPFVYRPAPGWVPPRRVKGGPQERCWRRRLPGGLGRSPEEEYRAREKQAWEQGLSRRAWRARAKRKRGGHSRAAGSDGQSGDANLRGNGKLISGEWKAKWFRWRWRWCARFCTVNRRSIRCCWRAGARGARQNGDDSHNVRLRAHPSQIPIWQEYPRRARRTAAGAGTDGRPALEQNQCVLETELGVTESESRNATEGNRTGAFRSCWRRGRVAARRRFRQIGSQKAAE